MAAAKTKTVKEVEAAKTKTVKEVEVTLGNHGPTSRHVVPSDATDGDVVAAYFQKHGIIASDHAPTIKEVIDPSRAQA